MKRSYLSSVGRKDSSARSVEGMAAIAFTDGVEYVCKQCRRQSSVTAGTVLHRTHLPLTVWFWAIYLVARDKRGISATQLSRELEIAYSSAWYLLHRLRNAMGERDKDYVLFGIIELDDAYFGAPSSNGKRGRGTDKTSALAAVWFGRIICVGGIRHNTSNA